MVLDRMDTVSDELCSIPSKRLKIDIMESSKAENHQIESCVNADKEDTPSNVQHDIAGAIIERAKLSGTDPRRLLSKLSGEDISFTDDVPDSAIWKLLITYLADHPRRKRLPHVTSLDHVIRLLETCTNIMVLTGAGVSVSCGIPDFRSRDGVYARLAQDFPDLPDPQAMFDIYYFRQNPKPFFKFAKEIFPGQFAPSPGHRFIRMLEKHNKLLRNYTQNIDTLEKEAGIEKVIECHGSFATASCTKCMRTVPGEEIREEIFAQRIPSCKDCGEDGIMKPDIVFFGEGLPDKFHNALAVDKDSVDLLIVIGSSLKVRPVALIPHSLPSHVPQILINRERLPHMKFDVELLGDCDVILDQLCHMLGKGWEGVRWREQPLKDLSHICLYEASGNTDDDNEEELCLTLLKHADEMEVRCQRIGKQEEDSCDKEEEEDVKHTSLDSSSGDSSVGEASNSSPLTEPVEETSAPNSPPEAAEADIPCDSWKPLPKSPPPFVPKGSYYRLRKRHYVFPGAELCWHSDPVHE